MHVLRRQVYVDTSSFHVPRAWGRRSVDLHSWESPPTASRSSESSFRHFDVSMLSEDGKTVRWAQSSRVHSCSILTCRLSHLVTQMCPLDRRLTMPSWEMLGRRDSNNRDISYLVLPTLVNLDVCMNSWSAGNLIFELLWLLTFREIVKRSN